MLEIILINIAVIIFGYLIGSISFSIIFVKKETQQDIRDLGSKNAGATNTLRTQGKKLGLIVFVSDVLKSFLSILIIVILVQFVEIEIFKHMIPQLAGAGAIIGHVYPAYFKFKGGKGAACLAGLLLSINFLLFILGIILFIAIVIFTKYVSVGSILAPLISGSLSFIPWFITGPLGGMNQIFDSSLFWISGFIMTISTLFIIFTHRSNIHRLLTGTENKISRVKK